MTKRTAIIWNDGDDAGLRYFVLDGDLTKFQGVYINGLDDREVQAELSAVMYNQDSWGIGHTDFNLESFSRAIADGATLIECGFLP